MAQISDCSKAQKAQVQKTFTDMVAKFGNAAANAAISVYNATLDGVKSLLTAEKTVLTPLASLDQLFLESFVKFPYNTISSTIQSTTTSLVAPLNTIGMLGGQCSDTQSVAKSMTSSIDSLNKDLFECKRQLDKLSLVSGDAVLKSLDNAISWIDQWKIAPIP